MPQPGETNFVRWAFHDKYAEVIMLGDKVAYSWTCSSKDPDNHKHVIGCLWVWHDCDQNLDPVDDHWTSTFVGWKPTGVGAHDLISSDPLHIEASVYWPGCCGLHGWIRDGRWVDVNDIQ